MTPVSSSSSPFSDCSLWFTTLSFWKDFGISHILLAWFTSYLSDCTHFIQLKFHFLGSFSVSAGVPQGSVLGPFLLIFYMLPLGYILRNVILSFTVMLMTLSCIFLPSSRSAPQHWNSLPPDIRKTGSIFSFKSKLICSNWLTLFKHWFQSMTQFIL